MEKYGEITDFHNSKKGFAFLTLSTKDEAQACISGMNDTDVAGRTVQMNIAKPKRPREQEPTIGNESEKYGLKMMAELKVKKEDADALPEGQEKEGINLGLSGALTADVNTFNGVVIKYAEPPEARLPKRRWRFYVFKGEEVLPTLHLHRQSAYLIGRDRKVAAQRK